ncbi:DUF106 domain-containing protein [Candidatus Woesearchaeota archaeon]|nr:DUF106 domain-containing protein [Candidatus Woesearchaeota archaeon]
MVIENASNLILSMNPLIFVSIMSLIVALLTTIVYKKFTNQILMKELKDELKELQKTAKELKEKPEEAMKAQKKMMEVNMKYMMHSMRATLVTFLPIILIFGWMNAHYSFIPLTPNTPFTITIEGISSENITMMQSTGIIIEKTIKENGITKIIAKLENYGNYYTTINTGGKTYPLTLTASKKQESITPITKPGDAVIKAITVSYEKLIVLNAFGWKIGWLGTYIIESIIFSMLLRKWMNVY